MKGTHKAADGSEFLQFILRFTLYKNSNKLDIMHTFIYDGDAQTDLIGGLSVDVTRKMSGSCMNRRVKLTGDYGIMHEPLQILNVWRPRIGTKYYDMQMRGENVDVSDAIDARNGQPCAEMLDNVTIWDSYKPVSYTHLDVYKRQLYSHGSSYAARVSVSLDGAAVITALYLAPVSYTHLDVYKRQVL